VGRGSTFTLHFPLARPAVSSQGEAVEHGSGRKVQEATD
jgi:hypothetical protein